MRKGKVLVFLVIALGSSFLLHCSLRSYPPQILVQISSPENLLVRGASPLSQLAVFAVSVNNMANTLSSADLDTRDPNCLLPGAVVVATYAQLLEGVTVTVSAGSHQFTIFGFDNSGVPHPSSLRELFLGSPNLKTYVVAQKTVDLNGVNGVTLSAVYDSNNPPADRLAQCSRNDATLHALVTVGTELSYLTKSRTGVWSNTLLPTPTQFGSLAIGPDGFVNISAGASGSGGVNYLTNSSGSFVSENVVSNSVTNGYNDSGIAVSQDGVVHIVANRSSAGTYHGVESYGHLGSWTVGSTALTTNSNIPVISTALKSGEGSFLVSQARSQTSSTPLHLNTATPGWGTSTTLIDHANAVPCYGGISKAVADIYQGHVHVAYLCDTLSGQTIGYANDLSGSFVSQSLASDVSNSYRSLGFSIDSGGQMHLAYSFHSISVNYALGSALTGTWQVPVSIYAGGNPNDVAITAQSPGSIHIIFNQLSDFDLHYLTNFSGSWVVSSTANFASVPAIQSGFVGR